MVHIYIILAILSIIHNVIASNATTAALNPNMSYYAYRSKSNGYTNLYLSTTQLASKLTEWHIQDNQIKSSNTHGPEQLLFNHINNNQTEIICIAEDTCFTRKKNRYIIYVWKTQLTTAGQLTQHHPEIFAHLAIYNGEDTDELNIYCNPKFGNAQMILSILFNCLHIITPSPNISVFVGSNFTQVYKRTMRQAFLEAILTHKKPPFRVGWDNRFITDEHSGCESLWTDYKTTSLYKNHPQRTKINKKNFLQYINNKDPNILICEEEEPATEAVQKTNSKETAERKEIINEAKDQEPKELPTPKSPTSNVTTKTYYIIGALTIIGIGFLYGLRINYSLLIDKLTRLFTNAASYARKT